MCVNVTELDINLWAVSMNICCIYPLAKSFKLGISYDARPVFVSFPVYRNSVNGGRSNLLLLQTSAQLSLAQQSYSRKVPRNLQESQSTENFLSMGSYCLLILHRGYPSDDNCYYLHVFPGYLCYELAYGNIIGIPTNVLSQPAGHFRPGKLENSKPLDHQHQTGWNTGL